MLTAELKVNGAMVGLLYLNREGTTLVEGVKFNVYLFRYHDIETGKVVSGHTRHRFEDGLPALVGKVLSDPLLLAE